MRVLCLLALWFSAVSALVAPAARAALKSARVSPSLAPFAAAVAPMLVAAPAFAADLKVVDLILPVGGLSLLLTGVIVGILGYTTIGAGPANPKNR